MVQLPPIEISKKKNLDRKTNMLLYYSGYRVGSANTSPSPVLDIKKKFGPKSENIRILFRVLRWHRRHLSFAVETFKNRDIEETFFGPKNENAHQLLRAPAYVGHLPLTCKRYRRKNFRTKKRKCSHTAQSNVL